MMGNYVLQRQPSTDHGTKGELFDPDGDHLCYTIERPWLNNQHEISSIPPGIYKCVRYSSLKFPNVWQVTGVTDRDLILIHPANTMLDLKGCIGPGSAFAVFNNEYPAVINSRMTMDRLRKILPAEFMLEVRA